VTTSTRLHEFALDEPAVATRRSILQGGAAILVGFSVNALLPLSEASAESNVAGTVRPPLTPEQLDSFLALRKDGSFVAFFGKIDPGQGLDVAISQIVAEELDISVDQVSVIQGDTSQTVDQGGASGSFGVEKGAVPLRFAAAEVRRILINRASSILKTPASALTTESGSVCVKAEPGQRVAYKDLIGSGFFESKLEWNGQVGNLLVSRGVAQPKSRSEYKLVGKSVPRTDIGDNVYGRHAYVTDIRLPNMLHARVIRPPIVGAEPVSIEVSSLKAIPAVQVIHERGIVAVLAEAEWNAVRAADALAVQWSHPHQPLIDQASLYDYLRTAPTVERKEEVTKGALSASFDRAHRTITASYEWPFQSHASLVGACAVADVNSDGATIWTGTQKPHAAQAGVAKLLGLPVEKVRAIWTRGPGSYGRNDAGDAALEAAFLSKAAGRPVRLQYTREQGTGWDPKGPASVHSCRAALDSSGNVTGYHFESRGFSRVDVFYNEADPRDTLPGQLLGLGQNWTSGFAAPGENYEFPATLSAWETVPALVATGSPLRTGHLRDPLGPQINFASEGFIDELASTLSLDPVEFRLRYLSEPRAIAVLNAAAAKFGWHPYAAASRIDRASNVVRGRGIALAQRFDTLCAAAVEIEVDRNTGAIRPLRWAVAHDCGLIINPDNLKLTIEGNIMQSTSRALHEEVTFDRDKVTSIDWISYPILDVSEAPSQIDIALINRPDLSPTGAGEAASRPVPAAIANALFDATGVRLRRAPFTPSRVKQALSQHTE